MARTEMPTSTGELQELVLQQKALIDEQAELITFYREWKRLIDSQRFGSRSEKIPAEQGQLFNEAEILAAKESEEESDEVAIPAAEISRRGSAPPGDLGRSQQPDISTLQRTRHF